MTPIRMSACSGWKLRLGQDFENISKVAFLACEHAQLPHPIHDPFHLGARRRAAIAVLDDIDASDQATATDVADQRMLVHKPAQALAQIFAGGARPLDETLARDHVEHRGAGGAGHGIAAEGGETGPSPCRRRRESRAW